MKKAYLAGALGVMLMSSSCKTQKSPMEYFIGIDDVTTTIPVGDYEVKIEPTDELWITVNSSNPEATAMYNVPASNPAMRDDILGQTTPKQQTFTVDTEGNIFYPGVGKIHVAGMTVDQLRDYITKEVSKEVKDPIVLVQMINYRINIAGEVAHPGSIYVTSPRFSVLDAISQAGDLTQYGERNNVLLIREENGERKHIRLNLNSPDILSSPYFFMKQNDYIYVQPNNIRKDNSEYNQFNSYRLSVISTIVSGSASVISLIIALTR